MGGDVLIADAGTVVREHRDGSFADVLHRLRAYVGDAAIVAIFRRKVNQRAVSEIEAVAADGLVIGPVGVDPGTRGEGRSIEVERLADGVLTCQHPPGGLY